jgi:Kef-type K+ transport system membrane component KefB
VGDHAYSGDVIGLIPLAAEAPLPDAGSLVLVLAAASVGAVLSRLHRRVVLPTVVLEIALGILIGPEGLDIAQVDSHIDFLADLGLVFLFFFAGLELVDHRVPRRSLVRGTSGWAVSLAIGIVVGLVLHGAGLDAEAWLLGVALSTTALGALVPILGDAGLLPTQLGSAVLGTGVAGEFWPIVVISIFLTGAYGAVAETLLLVAFGVVVLLAAAAALRARPPRVVDVLRQTVHTTGQAAVRLSVLSLGALVFLAIEAGFDFVLGAFAGGLVVGLALGSPEAEPVRMRLEGVGFGFLIPIYFVVTGMNFDLDSLLTPTGLALGALFLSLLVVVRGIPSVLWLRELGARRTVSLGLFAATGLPLIVAIVGIGTDRGAIADDVGTSLIGAGMISVLLFPLIATAIAGRGRDAVSIPSRSLEEAAAE